MMQENLESRFLLKFRDPANVVNTIEASNEKYGCTAVINDPVRTTYEIAAFNYNGKLETVFIDWWHDMNITHYIGTRVGHNLGRHPDVVNSDIPPASGYSVGNENQLAIWCPMVDETYAEYSAEETLCFLLGNKVRKPFIDQQIAIRPGDHKQKFDNVMRAIQNCYIEIDARNPDQF